MKKLIPALTLAFLFSVSVNAQDVKIEPNEIIAQSQDVLAVKYSPDGNMLAVALWDKSVVVYSIDTTTGYQVMHTLNKHTMQITGMAFSRDNKLLATVADDKMVVVWDTETGEIKHTFSGHTDKITGVEIDPSLRFVITTSLDQTVRFWDMKPPPTKDPKKTTNRIQKLSYPATALTVDVTGRMIYVAGNNNIEQLSVVGKVMKTFEGHTNTITGLARSIDKKHLASMSADRSIIIWDITTGKQKFVLKGHSWDINSIEFTLDSKYLVSGGKDGKVILWDVATGAQVTTFQKEGTKVVNGASVRADNATIAAATMLSGSPQYGIVLWNSGVERILPTRPTPAKGPKAPGQRPAPKSGKPAGKK